MPSLNSQQLRQIAHYLSGKQRAILQQWKDLMQRKDRKASELILESRGTFYNSIPVFLEHFSHILKNEPTSFIKVSEKHGVNRWEYGYELQEVVQEWEVLHNILLDHIDSSQDALISDWETIVQAQKLLAKSIHDGILFSVKKFDELQKREARAQMRDLKQIFQQPDTLSLEDFRETSHDLKGTVHIMRTGLFLLKNEKLDEKPTEIIGQMTAAAETLNHLLNDLLDLFRLEAGQEQVNATEFDAAEVLTNLCESMQPLAQTEQLDLRCEGDEKLMVQNDVKKVQRIVQNLVLNSLKYTSSGFVRIKWQLKTDKYWLIEIKDTGPGLSSTHAASLTTGADSSETKTPPPKTGDPEEIQSHGEGIGLLIVRRLCKLLNAIIKVETEKDKGTTYHIILPVEAEGNG
ncbi:MAG TPA: HAMP domain-containing sensor histidine kinase [Balneolaceae bacterium]|nr:HAMP domain-containing sensor histidine kinase [Balneolaceae bacterium]